MNQFLFMQIEVAKQLQSNRKGLDESQKKYEIYQSRK